MRRLWPKGKWGFVRGWCGRDAVAVGLLLHCSLPLCLEHVLLFLEVGRAQWGFLLVCRWPLSLLLTLLCFARLGDVVVSLDKFADHVRKVLLDALEGILQLLWRNCKLVDEVEMLVSILSRNLVSLC